MKIWIAVCVVVAGLAAGVAIAGNPHAKDCKGDPHKCAATVTLTNSTSTDEAPPTQTVTVTSTTSSTSTDSHDVYTYTTLVVPPSADLTILRLKVKTVRRYCTRQRHGWRCYKKRPPYAPHR